LRAAHTQASDILNKLQNLYSGAEEEALMRYNGMFISTWDLIAKAQTKMQSELAVAQALAQIIARFRLILDNQNFQQEELPIQFRDG
jgi:hypothetical protein